MTPETRIDGSAGPSETRSTFKRDANSGSLARWTHEDRAVVAIAARQQAKPDSQAAHREYTSGRTTQLAC